MQFSIIGLIVCFAVLTAGFLARGALIVSLIASLAFGATAVVAISSLGGSSPLIYTYFAILLIVSVAARRLIWREIGTVFGQVRPLWVLCCLMVYAVVGCWLLPRLFAGQTTVFVQSQLRQGVVESALEPVSANISQTAYFVLGGLVTIALCVLLLHSDRMDQIRRGFLFLCVLHASMGMLDLLGKIAGAGDVLQPIRTASYAMLTNVGQSGFFRIAGAYSEASAFAGASLGCLGFAYTYWRRTDWAPAKWLTLVLLALILLSTSSTAYGGLTILVVPVAISLLIAVLSNRVKKSDLQIVAALVVVLLVVLAVTLYNHRFFEPFARLLDSVVFDKAASSSGQERTYWNMKSLQALTDTQGLGIGFGSSRASSWPIAVLSQLGFLGTAMVAALLFVVLRGLHGVRAWVDPETDAVVSSVQACALAGIVGGSLASGTADPGMIFFIALAVISATRARARRSARAIEGDYLPAPPMPATAQRT
ncbi:hypothetical protein [Pseudaminobacter soli (ex Li et al. 2025)]|uniref:O-antigen ligase domain-containing protein n=1 Tax=Pseudaminobacter soli (ex Li et al. 2025) TaxID=1295366 RepID=A0A2P7S7Y3_9HYPH|nr:hypothetical protein [Mesorhizobium soli]PSJ58541.1 hypothetical protein C7I85_19270 [Mesorhizobium soli]